jgi:large subunit ribosomal protein L9
VTVNVARSVEEAERQKRGERPTAEAEDDDEQAPTAENIFEGDSPQPN